MPYISRIDPLLPHRISLADFGTARAKLAVTDLSVEKSKGFVIAELVLTQAIAAVALEAVYGITVMPVSL